MRISDQVSLLDRQQAFGFTQEDIKTYNRSSGFLNPKSFAIYSTLSGFFIFPGFVGL
jgi:hypothetical protein